MKKILAWIKSKFPYWPGTEAELFLMSLAMVLSCVWFVTYGKLVEVQYVIDEKVKVITQQAETIETYKIRERTIRLPGKTAVVTVSNTELQQAVRRANREAAELRETKQHYQEIISKYKHASPVVSNPAQRVATEERNNDQFIQDWKSGQ